LKKTEWWRSTAQHMWRAYFALKRQQEDAIQEEKIPPPMSDANTKIFEICEKIFSNSFVKADQDILKMYFTSRWGDDLYAVEDYSLKHNIPVNVIWIVISRANRAVMEETGLLERKEETDNGKETTDT